MEHVMEFTMLNGFRATLVGEEKSKATVDKYLRDLETFYRFARGKVITKELVIRFKQELVERYAPASVNSMLAAINRFFKEQGWYDCVVKSLKIQRQSFREKERELTKAEYFRLLQAAKERGNTRLYVLMQTMCATGIRVSEVRFITMEAVRRGRATVSLKGKIRQVLLPADLCRELKRYAKEQGIRAGQLFVTKSGKPLDRSNILHEMKALCKTAGVERTKVFPHNLRHLFACLYYKVSKDLSRLADVLGHTNVNTTRIYTCVSGMEHVRQLERLGLVI